MQRAYGAGKVIRKDAAEEANSLSSNTVLENLLQGYVEKRRGVLVSD